MKGPIIHKANVFTREHVYIKNSILEKPNVTQKFDGTSIALLRKPLKWEIKRILGLRTFSEMELREYPRVRF